MATFYYYKKCQYSQWLVLQEFGEETKRLMCWPHTSKKIDDKLVILQRESKNPELARKIKTDINFFQWATTETEYENNFEALKEKYTRKNPEVPRCSLFSSPPSLPSSSSKRKADVNVNTRTKRSRAV